MRGIVEQHAHLGVEVGRARIEVERTDEAAARRRSRRPWCAGWRRCCRTAAAAAAALGLRRIVSPFRLAPAVRARADLVQAHAAVEQAPAIFHIAGIHRRHVVGRQRIGDHADLRACASRTSSTRSRGARVARARSRARSAAPCVGCWQISRVRRVDQPGAAVGVALPLQRRIGHHFDVVGSSAGVRRSREVAAHGLRAVHARQVAPRRPAAAPPRARARPACRVRAGTCPPAPRSGPRLRCSSSASKIALACATFGPNSTTSRSRKLVSVEASKYSSPMLRPPSTATRPSAIQALLCMRWLTL